MASQNDKPTSTSITTAPKGTKPSGGSTMDPVGKRLQQELMTLIMHVYEDVREKLSLEFPSGYPYNVPTVKLLPPCYLSSLDIQGNICLDILKDKWSALYDIRTVLFSIQSLPGEPNLVSPLNTHAAQLWKTPLAFKKYLQETCAKQVSSQEP
ncbi:ubiquitin-conjugating enzyme E2 C-like [Rhynchonycteris naso]